MTAKNRHSIDFTDLHSESMAVIQEVFAAWWAWTPPGNREVGITMVTIMEQRGFFDGVAGKPWRQTKHNKRHVWEAGMLARHLETLGGQQ